VTIGTGRVIVGISGSVRSLLEATTAARSAAELVLAWAPAGGELAYMRAARP
jgi:hypothetical protein